MPQRSADNIKAQQASGNDTSDEKHCRNFEMYNYNGTKSGEVVAEEQHDPTKKRKTWITKIILIPFKKGMKDNIKEGRIR